MPQKFLIVTDDAGESCEVLHAQHRRRDHGKIITAQTWQSHPDFHREIITQMGTAS